MMLFSFKIEKQNNNLNGTANNQSPIDMNFNECLRAVYVCIFQYIPYTNEW